MLKFSRVLVDTLEWVIWGKPGYPYFVMTVNRRRALFSWYSRCSIQRCTAIHVCNGREVWRDLFNSLGIDSYFPETNQNMCSTRLTFIPKTGWRLIKPYILCQYWAFFQFVPVTFGEQYQLYFPGMIAWRKWHCCLNKTFW